MGEARHDLRQPFRRAPDGSGLEHREAFFNERFGPQYTHYTFVMEHADALAAWEVAQLGLTATDVPPYLLATRAEYLRGELRRNPKLAGGARKPGRPGADGVLALILWVEYLRHFRAMPGASDNRIHETVAHTLGPGINRKHVYRLVKRVSRQMNERNHAGDPEALGWLALWRLNVEDAWCLMAEYHGEIPPGSALKRVAR